MLSHDVKSKWGAMVAHESILSRRRAEGKLDDSVP